MNLNQSRNLTLLVALASPVPACGQAPAPALGAGSAEGATVWPTPAAQSPSSPNSQLNPWLRGFGGADEETVSAPGSSTQPEQPSSAEGDDDIANSAGGAAGPQSEGQAGKDEPDRQPWLLLTEYFEGAGSEKALTLRGDPAGSECSVEIYSNGNDRPWRTLSLPDPFPTGGEVRLCSEAVDAPDCTAELSGSVYNGNDALVVRCTDSIMDSFGRVGEDPGTHWVSGAVKSSDSRLLRCDSTPDRDPFDMFYIDSAWVTIQEGESSADAARRCKAPGVGGAAGAPAR